MTTISVPATAGIAQEAQPLGAGCGEAAADRARMDALQVGAPAADDHAATMERLARDLLADPCHLLRRACQIADYGVRGERDGDRDLYAVDARRTTPAQ
jgi:hypothetical protein